MLIPELKFIELIKKPNEPFMIDDFAFQAIAHIGLLGEERGADYFYFLMATPKALLTAFKENHIVNRRAMFIVNESKIESDLELVKMQITEFLLDCKRETWEEVALAINYCLDWEYYDPAYGICEYYKKSRNLS